MIVITIGEGNISLGPISALQDIKWKVDGIVADLLFG